MLERPLSIETPGKGKVLQGFTSTLLKVDNSGNWHVEGKCRKHTQEDAHPSSIWWGLQQQAGLFSIFLKDGGGLEETGRERGQFSKVCQTSYFVIFSTGNGQFPKAWSYRSTGLILQKPMYMDNNLTWVVRLAGQKYLQFCLFNLLN